LRSEPHGVPLLLKGKIVILIRDIHGYSAGGVLKAFPVQLWSVSHCSTLEKREGKSKEQMSREQDRIRGIFTQAGDFIWMQ
jgi:hypothetical protein